MLALIKRTFVYIDKHTFSRLYTALVRTHLEFTNIVWYPYHRKDIEGVKRVQMRATRLVLHQKHIPQEIILNELKLPSLAHRRLNCAPLVADLFLFCYERDFMLSLSDNNQTDIIEAFINST